MGASLIRMAAITITSPLLERLGWAKLVEPVERKGGSVFAPARQRYWFAWVKPRFEPDCEDDGRESCILRWLCEFLCILPAAGYWDADGRGRCVDDGAETVS